MSPSLSLATWDLHLVLKKMASENLKLERDCTLNSSFSIMSKSTMARI